MSRRFKIAPALHKAAAETTKPVGRTKPSHSRCAAVFGSGLAIRSVRLRPEIDQAHRLNSPSANLVKGADALRLPLQVAVELLKAATPSVHVGLQLSLFFCFEAQSQLVGLAFVFVQFFADVVALTLQGGAEVGRFFFAPAAKLLSSDSSQFVSAWLELRQKFVNALK